MTNFPNSLDSDLEIPPISDNVVEIGGEVINALRAAVFAVEENIGINAHGSTDSISDRLSVSINDDGSLRYSALVALGILTYPIRDNQVAADAGIVESKLFLNHTTQSLFDQITILDNAVDVLNNWLSVTGIKLSPHIAGTQFNHLLSHIDVDSGSLNRVNITGGTTIARDLTNAYTFTAQVSNDLLIHTRADGYNNDTTPPANMAHNALGLYINPANFISIPQTVDDLQTFAEYVDSSSLALLGSRTQNLYANGIPRASRASSLVNNEAGEAILDPTPATAYLLYLAAVNPVDNIDHGDNVILLRPEASVLSNNTFDAQFSQVKSGDYITIIYNDDIVPVTFTIDSARKFLDGTDRVYIVRIHGKNLIASSEAIIRIDRPFYHESKYNQLAVVSANNSFAEMPSLIIGSPRGATALGINFNADHLDSNHYNLYLAFYPTGNPLDKCFFLPAIDVTGNVGATPGKYTLNSIVNTINDKFREPGFNYRFIAFSYQGNIGISLADHYDDASFSIISGVPDASGSYISTSNDGYVQNIIDNYGVFDPFGLGFAGSNLASPPFQASYGTPLSALTSPTIIFAPIRRNFFYVDGVEKDNFALEAFTTRDGYGDGYWNATLTVRTALSGRVEVSYDIHLDLSTSGLKEGKTLVIMPAVAYSSGSYNSVDYGRFTISNVMFTDCPGPDPLTTITVYDGIHGTGSSPASSSENIPVKVYFSDDSVSFDGEHVSDPSVHQTFKRQFEIYINPSGKSFAHERARFNTNGSDITVDPDNGFILYSDIELAPMNLIDVSPKLRGYTFGQYKKITLYIYDYVAETGVFSGYLCKFQSPSTYTNLGPYTFGKKGEITRFYDETLIDYIDFVFPLENTISSFSLKQVDIQLFPSLELNQEKFLLAKCQVDDSNNVVEYLLDARQFGNVSEKQFSTSALNYIGASDRLTSENGVIRGFDVITSSSTAVSLKGGTALIDGKIVEFNEKTLHWPLLQEALYPAFSTTFNSIKYFLCANKNGDYEFVASTDYEVEDAASYGALDHNRIFYAKNPNSPSTPAYAIRSGYLHKVMTEMHDLVPLHLVEVTVALVGPAYVATSSSASDMRRFIEKGYQGLAHAFTLGLTASYRSIASLNRVLKELTNFISFATDKRNTFGQTVYVKDNFDISNINFTYATPIAFIGDGGSFNTDATYAIIGNNVEFNNIPITIESSSGLNLQGDNISIINCVIDYNYDATADGGFTIANYGNITQAALLGKTSVGINLDALGHRKNIKIDGNTFNTQQANHFPFVSLLIEDEADYMEEISISNNKLNGLSESSSDDKRAVIVVSSTSVTAPASPTGPRLTNCNIVNNTCNKNQMILMSANVTGEDSIANMLVPVDVIIGENICGSICYLTRGDQALNIANTTRIKDKNNMFHVIKNTCRYIFCGTNEGFINASVDEDNPLRVTYDIITGSALYSSSATIANNVCSWIQIGARNPASFIYDMPLIIVHQNRLTAFDASFLEGYYNGIAAVNIGLIVDSIEGT